MGTTVSKLDPDDLLRFIEIQKGYVDSGREKIDFSQPTGNESDDEEEEEKEEGGGQRRTVEEDVRFESYKPSKLKVEGMRPHPSDAVENGTLATVAPPARFSHIGLLIARELRGEHKLLLGQGSVGDSGELILDPDDDLL